MFEILYKKTQTSLQINNTHPDPDQQTWLKAKKILIGLDGLPKIAQ